MANSTVNKVVLGTETLLDLTGDTATAADVAEGKTFHLANGVQTVGTASGGSSGSGGVTVRGARVTVPKRTSTAMNSGVAVNGLDGIGAHDIVLFFGTGGYVVCPIGFNGINYMVHVSSSNKGAFDAFAAIISPNYEVGSQASIVGSSASLCNTTTPLVGDTVTITASSGSAATFEVFDAASGGVYATSSTVEAGGTYSFTVECATSYISATATASGGGNN